MRECARARSTETSRRRQIPRPNPSSSSRRAIDRSRVANPTRDDVSRAAFVPTGGAARNGRDATSTRGGGKSVRARVWEDAIGG